MKDLGLQRLTGFWSNGNWRNFGFSDPRRSFMESNRDFRTGAFRVTSVIGWWATTSFYGNIAAKGRTLLAFRINSE